MPTTRTKSPVATAPTNRRTRSQTAPTTEELPLHRFKADFFGTLAHPTRIRIIELLRDGEKSAGELVTALGLEQSNVSQHLARLREKNILVARKQGIGVFYGIRDPKLFQVLDLLREYFHEHLSEIQGMMRQL